MSHIKKMLLDFFERRRQMMVNMRSVPEPKVTDYWWSKDELASQFLLLVQYESVDLLHDIERALSSILELRSCVFDKTKNINRDELNDL